MDVIMLHAVDETNMELDSANCPKNMNIKTFRYIEACNNGV